ncbi:hypothetical protein N9T51_02460 [Pseudomonadota bacterium]|nr:hypothetical protein [Pseudomonadota bacterium]
MASLLKQIDSHPLVKYVLLSITGATSFLAFSPFNLKLVIVLTYTLLLYSVMSSKSMFVALKRSIAWGTGYWLGGTGWLIVSIYYYGNTNIFLASIIIILMAILLSIVFIGPICLIYSVIQTKNYFVRCFLCAGILTVIELFRFVIGGGLSLAATRLSFDRHNWPGSNSINRNIRWFVRCLFYFIIPIGQFSE